MFFVVLNFHFLFWQKQVSTGTIEDTQRNTDESLTAELVNETQKGQYFEYFNYVENNNFTVFMFRVRKSEYY